MGSNFPATDAEGYELQMGRWSRLLAPVFLRFVGLNSPRRVLDVGCGTGSLTRAVAEQTSAEVVGVDVASPYVEHARTQVRDRRVSFEVQDASSLSFPSGTFDAALSILVLNFIPEYRAAAAEMLRVVRSGGQVGAACWSMEGGFPAVRIFWETAVALDPAAATRRNKHISAPLTRPGELAALFAELGAEAIEEADLTIWMRFANFDDFWRPYLTGQAITGGYVMSLETDRRDKMRTALRDAYCAGREDGPRAYAAIAHAIRARVP